MLLIIRLGGIAIGLTIKRSQVQLPVRLLSSG